MPKMFISVDLKTFLVLKRIGELEKKSPHQVAKEIILEVFEEV
jgi:hypothetical protein